MISKENILEAIKEWQNRLKLDHWVINLSDEKPRNDDATAEIIPIDGRYVAEMRISEYFYETTPEDQSNSIVHELLHLPEDRIRQTMRCVTKNMSQDMKESVYDLVTMDIEYFNDWLATRLSTLLPAPDSLLIRDSDFKNV